MTSNTFNPSYIGLREDLLKYIHGKNLYILDIGCASGANGKFLKEKGYASYLSGIEIDKSMVLEAKNIYNEVLNDDLDQIDTLNKLECKKYDYVIVGDVLEHLKNPWNTLFQLKKLLNDTGKIIISLPNIRHIDVLIHIFIKGYWPYNDRGIFDKTHLRFFTKKNIEQLVDQAELKIETLERKFRFRDAIQSKFPFYGKILRKLFPEYYTFQFIVVCSLQIEN